jgi:hypothetical protein
MTSPLRGFDDAAAPHDEMPVMARSAVIPRRIAAGSLRHQAIT